MPRFLTRDGNFIAPGETFTLFNRKLYNGDKPAATNGSKETNRKQARS
jgi:hypothetical protein